MRGTVRLASGLPGTLLASKWACKATLPRRVGAFLSRWAAWAWLRSIDCVVGLSSCRSGAWSV
jgi:hypothetical protein